MGKKYLALLLVSLVALVVLLSCYTKGGAKHSHSFYFWKTQLSIDSTEAKMIGDFAVQHFYIRYFDVQWSSALKKAVPVGSLEISYPFYYRLENYTPCVFITNSVFENASDDELNELAENLLNKIARIDKEVSSLMANYIVDKEVQMNSNNWDSTEKVRAVVHERELKRLDIAKNEIQIDCDWTAKTASRYFGFLKKIKKGIGNRQLSCTLRLWQYQNQGLAGIPPVDRCLLMCYSLANPKKIDIENSIASYDQIKMYINAKKYPLKLDVALPLYSWAILFRNGQFKGILGAADERAYLENKSFYLAMDKHRFQVKRDTVVADTYLRYGDEIRVEQVSEDELVKIADLLAHELDLDKSSRVSLFSWDTIYIKQYDKEKIKKVYGLFD